MRLCLEIYAYYVEEIKWVFLSFLINVDVTIFYLVGTNGMWRTTIPISKHLFIRQEECLVILENMFIVRKILVFFFDICSNSVLLWIKIALLNIFLDFDLMFYKCNHCVWHGCYNDLPCSISYLRQAKTFRWQTAISSSILL